MTAGHIVVGIDGSENSSRAVDWAQSWASALGREMTLVCAVPAPPGRNPDSPGLDTHAREVLDAELGRLGGRGGEVAARAVVRHPVTELVEASQEAAAVVVGTTGRGGWRGGVTGSVSGNVAAAAHAPTVVVPPSAASTFSPDGPLVVGFDGSEAALAAARQAVASAAAEGRSVRLVQADTGKSSPAEPLDALVSDLRAEQPGVDVELVTAEGGAVDVLTDHSEGAAFVIVASNGHRGVPGFLLGSTARGLTRSSKAPVLVLTRLSERSWPVVSR